MSKPTTAPEAALPPWDGSVPSPVRSMWERGYTVIPQRLIDGGKIPIYPYKEWQEKRPPWGVIEDWALANPGCLWAIVVPQDECRLDFDVQHGAAEGWVGLTPSIWTPHGGVHVSVKVPFRVKSAGQKQKELAGFPGMEVLGHPHLATFYGDGYEEGMGETYALDDLPPALRDAIAGLMWTEDDQQTAEIPEGFDDFTQLSTILREMVDKVRAGETRNEVGFWGFCQARDERFDIDEVRQFALERYLPQVTDLGKHPYRQGEAFESVMSAFSRPPREPRGLQTEGLFERKVKDGLFARRVKAETDLRWAQERAVLQSGRSRHFYGGEWLFDRPVVDPVWGTGSKVLWASKQPLLVVAADGLGKTSLAEQLCLSLLGVRPPRFLGFDITPLPDDEIIVYLSMDRPDQARLSMLRMVDKEDRAYVETRLQGWEGPLPISMADSSALADWLQLEYGNKIGVVVADTYTQFGMPLSDDATGIAVNSAVAEVIARDIEWLGLNHPTKDGRTLRVLEDAYGSRHLFSGCGSVLGLRGAVSGTTNIELVQLKTPTDTIFPLKLVHDHATGTTMRSPGEGEVLSLLEEATENDGPGVDEVQVCVLLNGTDGGPDGSRSAIRKRNRRMLENLEEEYPGRVWHTKGKSGGVEGGGNAARWFARPMKVEFEGSEVTLK